MAMEPSLKKQMRKSKKGKATVDTSKIAKNPDKIMADGLPRNFNDLPQEKRERMVADLDKPEQTPKQELDMEKEGYSSTIVSQVPRKKKKAAKPKRDIASAVEKMATPEVKEQVVAATGVENAEEKPKKKGGLSSSFKNAITHLAPQALGMLVGGLMEGTDGAVEGYEKGRQVTQDLHNLTQQDQQMEVSQQNAETQRMFADAQAKKMTQKEKGSKTLSKDWISADGSPVFTDKDGTITNTRGEVVTDVKKAPQDISPLEAARIQNYENVEKNRQFRQDQANEGDAQRALKDLRGTEEYKTSVKMSTQVPVIRKLLTDAKINGGQSLSMLGPKIAKGIAGEVGVLTEQDVKRYIKDPSLIGGMRDTLAKLKSGKVSEVTAGNVTRLLDIMDQHAKDRISEATAREAKLFSRRSGLSVQEARSMIDANSDISTPSGGQGFRSKLQFNK